MGTTTLWNILNQNIIEVPIIQRDYAQGREGKEYLRERFLGTLIESIQKDTDCPLDFVYGTTEYGSMKPLDGQQRLTTLWLLHWYIAVRAGVLTLVKDILKKFTYETRISSRDFCNKLCCDFDAEIFNNQHEKNIVDYIKTQTWFHSSYLQDPTIQGMLRTIGGTNIVNSKNEDITDGIEEFLGSLSREQFVNYWSKLTNDDKCRIRFYFRDMEDNDMPLSDDLYIKMNARGKQLTGFENFKADWVGYAPNADEPDKKLLDNEITVLIDNAWTDIFWKEAVSSGLMKVDDFFFAFLKRYFLGKYIACSNERATNLKSAPLFTLLYKENVQEYHGLKVYYPIMTQEVITDLKHVFCNYQSAFSTSLPSWPGAQFKFLPTYKDENIVGFTREERVLFFAMCTFLEKSTNANQDSFKEWMRIIWNIVKNGKIGDEEALIGAIRLVDELSNKCDNILKYLASDMSLKSKFAESQVLEERHKAKLLLSQDSSRWRELLHKCEGHKFLHGNVGCLLRDENASYTYNYDLVLKKFQQFNMYFSSEGIREDYKKNNILLRIFVSYSDYRKLWKFIFDNSASSWFDELQNEDLAYSVHRLLTNDVISLDNYSSPNANSIYWYIHNTLINTAILNEITSGCRLRQYGGCYYLMRDNAKSERNKYMLIPERNNYLVKLAIDNTVELENKKQILTKSKLFYGWNVYFKYNGRLYNWSWENIIILLRTDRSQSTSYKVDSQEISSVDDVLNIICKLVQVEKDGKKGSISYDELMLSI